MFPQLLASGSSSSISIYNLQRLPFPIEGGLLLKIVSTDGVGYDYSRPVSARWWQ